MPLPRCIAFAGLLCGVSAHGPSQGRGITNSLGKFSTEVTTENTMKANVDIEKMLDMLRDLAAIALTGKMEAAPNGRRDSCSLQFNDTVDYMFEAITNLSSKLEPKRQGFMALGWRPNEMKLEQLGLEADDNPNLFDFKAGSYEDFVEMSFGPGGGAVEGEVHWVNNTGANTELNGCVEKDFENLAKECANKNCIALITFGGPGCYWPDQFLAAERAGAKGVLAEGRVDVPLQTDYLVSNSSVNGFYVSSKVAERLKPSEPQEGWPDGQKKRVRMTSTAERGQMGQTNLCVDLPGGNPKAVVMFGAHLDSAWNSAGLVDNGAASVGLIELIRTFGERFGFDGSNSALKNTLRMCWWTRNVFWGPEKITGSEYYLSQLSEEEKLNILGYINLDMIASKSATPTLIRPGPKGCPFPAFCYLQKRLEAACDTLGLPWEENSLQELWGVDGFQELFPTTDIHAPANYSLQHTGGDTMEDVDEVRVTNIMQACALVAEELLLDAKLPDHLNVKTPAPDEPTPAPSSGLGWFGVVVIGLVVIGGIALMLVVPAPSPAAEVELNSA